MVCRHPAYRDPQDGEHPPDHVQHGTDGMYAVGSHPRDVHTLQMACNALHIMGMDGTMDMAISSAPPYGVSLA